MAGAGHYFPTAHQWERREPEEVGMDPRLIQEAVELHRRHETQRYPRGDMREGHLRHLAQEPHNELIGPFKDRGDINGMILRHGYIVAEWGDTRRVDMTFSITKSYISAVAGLAYDRGLIPSVHDRVADSVQDGGFDSEHNRKITWHQLLNQTSHWEGVLWGKPDWADRATGPDAEHKRPRHEPGEVWQYNDVRVNRLALALLQIWRRPLPQVLREYLMDPIGASPTWRWHGYENSWVTIDGQQMQSVSGGGHWGGGLWISTRDHARFGYLCLRQGRWGDRQILPEEWLKLCTTPVAGRAPSEEERAQWSDLRSNPGPMPASRQFSYGYMNFFLNTGRHLLPQAPEESHFHSGAGCNFIWVDPVHDLVVVLRWLERDALDDFLGLVVRAVKD